MAAELADHVNKMVNEIFAEFKVEQHVRRDTTHYIILHDETRCLQFRFSGDFSILHINGLKTCGDRASGRNGKSLMELMDRLAASIPTLKYIELQDESELVFCGENINLAHLKILTSENAESWYGSLGYKSPTDEADKGHNQIVRNMTVDEAFSYGIIDPSDHSYNAQKMKFFGHLKTDKMLVKDYVNAIFNSIRDLKKDKCTSDETEKSTFVHTTINALGKLLIHGGKEWHQQSPILQKPIRTGFGGTTKKRRASRKRASRKRASRKRSKSRRN